MNKNFKLQEIKNNTLYDLITARNQITINKDLNNLLDGINERINIAIVNLNNNETILDVLYYQLQSNYGNDNYNKIDNTNNNIIWFYLNHKQGWKMLTQEEKNFIKKYSIESGHASNFFQAKYNMLNYSPPKNNKTEITKVSKFIKIDKYIFEKLGSNMNRYIYTSILNYLPTSKKIIIDSEFIKNIGVKEESLFVAVEKMKELELVNQRNNQLFFN